MTQGTSRCLVGDLSGRVAIITGGNSLLGGEIALALHTAGASIVIAARDEERGEAAARELGRRALFVRTDVSDDHSIRSCVAATLARYE